MKLLIFSDIHGDQAALKRLVNEEADYYFAAGDLATWGRGLDRLGPILQSRAGRVYVIPGNHESAADIVRLCDKYGLQDFHGRSITINGHIVAGLGYSNPTPFHTPGEYSEEELAQRLDAFTSPEILICHCPPKDTRLDLAGPGQHFGSVSVRNYLEKIQPAYFYCGHIHESAGATDRIGRTIGYNVGKQGRVLEV